MWLCVASLSQSLHGTSGRRYGPNIWFLKFRFFISGSSFFCTMDRNPSRKILLNQERNRSITKLSLSVFCRWHFLPPSLVCPWSIKLWQTQTLTVTPHTTLHYTVTSKESKSQVCSSNVGKEKKSGRNVWPFEATDITCPLVNTNFTLRVIKSISTRYYINNKIKEILAISRRFPETFLKFSEDCLLIMRRTWLTISAWPRDILLLSQTITGLTSSFPSQNTCGILFGPKLNFFLM